MKVYDEPCNDSIWHDHELRERLERLGVGKVRVLEGNHLGGQWVAEMLARWREDNEAAAGGGEE